MFNSFSFVIFLDNIDTRRALEDGIRDLVSSSNNYIKSKKSTHSLCNRKLLTSVMTYISKILKVCLTKCFLSIIVLVYYKNVNKYCKLM